MGGYIAFQEDKVIGWCTAGESKLFAALPDAEDTLARIICFNIDPDLRQQGVAGVLLDLVIEDLIERGFAAIEAAPSIDETTERSFQGTVSMFSKRGFEQVMNLPTGQVLMRRHID